MVENYAKWKIDLFCVLSKVPEFLLVAFKLLEIHWAAFFPLFYASFSRKNVCKKPRFSRRHVFEISCSMKNKRNLLFVSTMKAAKHCIHARLPGFLHTFFSKKNEAQCISSNLKATSKNSGTFETHKKVDFPLSIVFDRALQLF